LDRARSTASQRIKAVPNATNRETNAERITRLLIFMASALNEQFLQQPGPPLAMARHRSGAGSSALGAPRCVSLEWPTAPGFPDCSQAPGPGTAESVTAATPSRQTPALHAVLP